MWPSAPGACLSLLVKLPPRAVRVFQVLSDREGAIQRFRWDHARAIHETGWRYDIAFLVHSCLILMPQVTKKLMEVKAVSTPEERSSLMAILESVYRCALHTVQPASASIWFVQPASWSHKLSNLRFDLKHSLESGNWIRTNMECCGGVWRLTLWEVE